MVLARFRFWKIGCPVQKKKRGGKGKKKKSHVV